MITASSTYVYTPLSAEEEIYISGSLLNDRGSWLAQLSYVPPYDVVTYGGALYINTDPVTGIPPTGIVDEHWSIIVVAEEASGTIFTDDGTRQAADQALKNQIIQQKIADAQAEEVGDYGTLAYLAYVQSLENGTQITNIYNEITILQESQTNIYEEITILQESMTNVTEQVTNITQEIVNITNIVYDGTDAANTAYELAVIGTTLGSSAYELAELAYSVAVNGTTQIEVLSDALDGKVDRSGDTMSGTLATVNVYYRAVTAGSSGTVAVDLSNAGFHTVNVAGDVHIVTTNRASGTLTRSTAVRFIGDSVDRNIGFAGEIRFLGSKPTVLTGNKYSVLSLTSFGPDETDTLAAYNYED